MSIDEAAMGTTRPPAAAVAHLKSPAKSRRDDPRLAPDVDRLAVSILEDRHDPRITEEPARDVRGDAIAEGRMSLESLRGDVEHHLDRWPQRRAEARRV